MAKKRTTAQRLDAVRRDKNITIARLQAEAVALLDALQAAEPWVVLGGPIARGSDVLAKVQAAISAARITMPLLMARRRREIEEQGAQIGEGEAPERQLTLKLD